MSAKILILGKGFIGQRLQRELKCPISAKRISHYKDVLSLIRKYKPKILINCIGHTGRRNVDDCELVFDQTLKANTFVPVILAEATLRAKVKLVHISSGCIYHYDYAGQKPITENQTPDYYRLYYSRTKIYSENILKELSRRHNILIVRLRIPLDNSPSSRNILTKLIRYGKVIDMPNSITYIPDFLKMVQHLLKKDVTGVYNTVNRGTLRYPKLLNIYQKYRPNFQYKIISYEQLKLNRTNLVLSTKKLEKTGFKVRTINEILEECVREYVRY